ncbi:MAG: hypothetical protein MRJ68_20585 [Nitrospira sp.]|nr:hypothetical protein [Nitrospira sp.]
MRPAFAIRNAVPLRKIPRCSRTAAETSSFMVVPPLISLDATPLDEALGINLLSGAMVRE